MLILVTGLPGSGKSALARAYVIKYGGIRICSDVVRQRLGLMGHYSPADKKQVYQAVLAQTREALASGEDVVVDSTFYQEQIRAAFAQAGKDTGAAVKWVEICAREETVRKRLQTARPDSEADFAVYAAIRDQYEPLKTPHLTLWSDDKPPEELAEEMWQYLNPL